ncbi:MAG TPA: type II toxin-antitoxin system RelE/ParE family toxin [Prolixibacteraceae bacterium]|jgi:mRNA interferase RelE/StbE
MKFEFEKAFARDFRKLKNKELAIAITEAILQVSEASATKEIANLKKLTGYRSAFRIRIGDYRIGVIIEKNIVTFVAFAHRKEIYKRFP